MTGLCVGVSVLVLSSFRGDVFGREYFTLVQVLESSSDLVALRKIERSF